MKKNLLLIFTLVIFASNFVNAQSISFVDPTQGEVVSGSGSQTTISVHFAYHTTMTQYPYVVSTKTKLETGSNTYWDTPTDEIPQFFNLAPGTYTWKLTYYELFLGTNYIEKASQTITFYVRHTIKVRNNIAIGATNVKIDGLSKTSGTNVLKSPGDNLGVGAIDQTYNGSYYVWSNGTDQSDWRIKKSSSTSNLFLSNNRNYTYSVQSNDNNAVITGNLRYDVDPPVAPQNLSVASGGNPPYPVLTWSANSESDLSGYSVYRQKDGGSWAWRANVTTNSYTDNQVITTTQPQTFTYRVRANDINGNYSAYSNTASIQGYQIYKKNENSEEEKIDEVPEEFLLSQNYPNPFNPSTSISYSIPKAEHVSIRVFNALGKEVANLVNGFKQQGQYSVQFDGSNLSSGIYYYEIRTNSYHSVKKMILTK